MTFDSNSSQGYINKVKSMRTLPYREQQRAISVSKARVASVGVENLDASYLPWILRNKKKLKASSSLFLALASMYYTSTKCIILAS